MADEKPSTEKEGSPKGAVEVDEGDLEQASGGSINFTRPTDSSLNFTKTEIDAQKVCPSDPSIPQATFTEKKI